MATAEFAPIVDPDAGARARLDPDRRAALRLVADRAAPVSLARERTLPVIDPLASLFPDGGLRRGSVVAVDGVGATSLALAVAAGPSAVGSWVAVVGDAGLGLAAAEEAGVALERMLVVDPAGSGAAGVLAALIGAVDIVVLGSRVRLRAAELRRLAPRLRERGSVLLWLGVGEGRGADLTLRVCEAQWSGLGVGHGLLRARRVRVQAHGRGGASRPRAAALLLPGPQGAPVALGEQAAPGEREGAGRSHAGRLVS